MFHDLMVVPACSFPEFLLENFCSPFVPSQHLCVCEEATASGGVEELCFHNVCVIIVRLRLRWD